MFKAYYFSLLRQRVTKSAKVQKPLPFVLGFIARVPEMNYRESVQEREKETSESHERIEKMKERRKEIHGLERERARVRERERSHLYHNNWERKEKKAKTKQRYQTLLLLDLYAALRQIHTLTLQMLYLL